ncbi:MAG TPA: serine/threonine-protein kinase [Kofleriaceae bacterium]
MRICAACTRSSEESARFCPHCGAEQPDDARSSRDPVAGKSGAGLVGYTINDQFVIDAVIGGGSFGSVYRGRQLGLDRAVAIKVPTHEIAADPVMAKRFAREARAAARVRHPGVVAIYAVGELADGRPYLAMELVAGEPLDKIVAAGPIPALRALGIVRAVASALGETHAAGVVHRDLKPSNIIWRVDRNGDDLITLVDFGIAVAKLGNAEATRLTQGGLIGTPHYMSPEQAHGDDVDARADLYALGCVLFELVTATTLFEGSAFEVLLAHGSRPAPVPSERNPDVPEAIDRLCAALLAKEPAARPADADALVGLVDQTTRELEAPVSPARSAARSRAAKPTGETRRELPAGAPPRRRGVPRWIVAPLATLALGSAAYAAYVIGRDHAGATGADAAREEPSDQPNGPIHAGSGRREVFQDDGELVLRALVPDPIASGAEIRPHLEIRNKLGQPIVAPEIVVTVADAHGAKGLTAKPHGSDSGHYDFHYTFPAPGHYTVRVFPPSVDSAFEIPVDVQ